MAGSEKPDFEHLRQALDALAQHNAAANALTSLRLQTRLGRVLMPGGSTRERLLRLLVATRRVLRSEGAGSAARRAWRKLSRSKTARLNGSSPSLPEGAQEPTAISELQLALDRLEDLEVVQGQYRRASRSAIEPAPTFVARDEKHLDGASAAVKVVAFYVPQDLPVEEDESFGPSVWTRVARAAPQFVGHYQPHLPDELGFYDIASGRIQEAQAEIARQYGIYGFCFQHYWPESTELRAAPIRSFANNPRIDFPFCLIWMNDGSATRSTSNDDAALAFLTDVLPHLANPRYIRIEGRPLILVNDPLALPDPKAATQQWREHATRNGLPGLYLIARANDKSDLREFGFDAAVEIPSYDCFQSENVLYDGREYTELRILNDEFTGKVYSYPTVVSQWVKRKPNADFRLFETAVPGWDDSSQYPDRGSCLAYSSPHLFQHWMYNLCERALTAKEEGQRFVFVNAWNDWGQGAHLEPDTRYGVGYLAAIRRTLELANRIAAAQSSPVPAIPGGTRIGSISGVEPFPDCTEQFKNPPTAPVFVYQLGKMGSTAVAHSLARAGVPEVFQVHVLHNLANSIRNHLKAEPEGRAALAHLEYCRQLRDWMDTSGPDVIWRVITMVREPVGRNVSAFFQALTNFIPDAEARLAANDLTVEEAMAVFLGMFRHELQETWFDTLLEPVFGVDIFSKPYDFEKGYQTYEAGPSRVLLIRREDLRRAGAEAIGNFVGIENFKISTENTSEDKAYSKLIEEFKKRPLPDSYLDRMYGGRIATHFYRPSELAEYRKRWTRA